MSKEGWTTVTLGDIAENISVRVDDPSKSGLEHFVGLEHLDTGEVFVSRWGSTGEYNSGKRFESGDVLLCRRRPYLKKCSAANFDGVCSGDAYVLRTKKGTIVAGLLKYILNTERFWNFCITNADGSMSTRVKWKDLSRYTVNLPGLIEQHELLKILEQSELSSSRNGFVEVDLKITKSRLLHSIDNINGVKFKLAQVVEVRNKTTNPSTDKEYSNLPLIAPNHIEKGTGRLLEVELASSQNSKSDKFIYSHGDVLYAKIRPNHRKVIVSNSHGTCSTDILPISTDRDIILPEYLKLVMLGRKFSLFSEAHSSGTGFPRINKRTLLNFELVIPPVALQKQFIDIWAALERTHDLSILKSKDLRDISAKMVESI